MQVEPVALSEGSERDLVRASDYPGARRVLRFDCAGRSGRERSLGGGRAQAAPGLPCEAAEPRWLVLGDTKPPESDSTAKQNKAPTPLMTSDLSLGLGVFSRVAVII